MLFERDIGTGSLLRIIDAEMESGRSPPCGGSIKGGKHQIVGCAVAKIEETLPPTADQDRSGPDAGGEAVEFGNGLTDRGGRVAQHNPFLV